MADQGKVKISFSESNGKMPFMEQEKSEDGSAYYKSKLLEVREMLSSGDIQKAIDVIDDCIEGDELEESDDDSEEYAKSGSEKIKLKFG